NIYKYIYLFFLSFVPFLFPFFLSFASSTPSINFPSTTTHVPLIHHICEDTKSSHSNQHYPGPKAVNQKAATNARARTIVAFCIPSLHSNHHQTPSIDRR